MKTIMNFLSICLIGILTIVNLQAQPSSIPLGSTYHLSETTRKIEILKSQNGKFILTLETSGIQTWSVDHSRFVWQVSGAPDFTKTFSLNNHGVLVIISNTDRSLWNSGTQNRGAQTLSLNNNGNLELLGGTSGTEVLWTGTANLEPPMISGNGDGQP